MPEVVIDLGKRKQVTVRQFNGVSLVDIREFYTDKASGELRPGKKGISLTADVWEKLLDSRDEVQAALAALEGTGGAKPKKAAQSAKSSAQAAKSAKPEAEPEAEADAEEAPAPAQPKDA